MPHDETDTKIPRRRKTMGTKDYDLEEQRGNREERTKMLAGFAKEKVVLIESHERTLKSKNWIIYALIGFNLFQAAMLLGTNLDFKATPDGGLEVSTGEAPAGDIPAEASDPTPTKN